MANEFDVNLVTGDQLEERTLNHYVPTLYIGLGGTGKDVLMRLRKRFHGLYAGKNSDYNKYLIIDTDQRRWWPGGDETEEDYLPVKPTVGEHVDCPITEQQFNSTFDSLELVQPPEYSWLKPEMRNEDHKAVIDGAGTHRQFGRMAFMLNESSIRGAIESHARAVLRSSAESENTQDTTVEQDIMEVVIVTSIAGGTGAGMFLDVCYAVRDLFQTKIRVKSQYTTLFAVMPTVFEQEVDKATYDKFQRNSYASLLEMEHYGTPRTDDELLFVGTSASAKNQTGFVAPWKGGEFIPGAGWHSCYLVDSTNQLSPHTPLSIGETYQMIADYLFLDYEQSDFAIKKRSNRCNLSQFQGRRLITSVRKANQKSDLATLKVDSDVVFATQNGCTFSAFGLAEINFNRQRVYLAASFRLAEHLLRQRWLSREDAMTDSRYIADTKKMCFEPEPNGSQTNPPSFLPDRLCNLLFSNKDTNFFAKALKDLSNVRGEEFGQGAGKLRSLIEHHIKMLAPNGAANQNAFEQAKSLKGRSDTLGPIRERLKFIARSTANAHGVSVAKKYSEYVRGLLAATRKTARGLPQPGGSPLARLDEADSIWFPARGLAQKIEYPRACDNAIGHVRRMYQHTAAGHIVGMMQSADNYLGSKEEEKPPELEHHGTIYEYLDQSEKQLKKILDSVRVRFEQTRQDEPNQRNQSLFPTNWTAEKYDDQINRALVSYAPVGASSDDGQQFDLDKLSDLVITQLRDMEPSALADVRTLTDLLDYWDALHLRSDTDILQITELLARACRAILFRAGLNLKAFFEGSVIDQLMLHSKPEERNTKLNGLVKASAPYLPLDIQSQASMTKNYQPVTNDLLGKRAGDGLRSQENEGVLLGQLAEQARVMDKSNRWNPSPLDSAATTLVLCRELWGIPLQYYDKLKFLHDAYRKTRDVDTCHIDYRVSWEDLPDVRNVDPQIYSHIRDNVENVLFAIIRRTIRCRPKDHSFVVMVPDEHSGVDRLKVGSRLSRIVRKVCEEEAVRSYLQRDQADWEDKAGVKEWAAVFASALHTYEICRREIEQEDDKRSAPIRNCIRMLLTRLKSRLAAQGAEGERWIKFLNPRDPSSAELQRKTDFYEHLVKKGLLIQSSEYVPIFEVDFDKLEFLELPDSNSDSTDNDDSDQS